MARRTASPALSPKILKHFAAATVVLTGLLALFASGDEWGAQAQVQAIEAKNQLVTTEAEKLGARKVATTLKIANDVGPATFADDVGENFGGGGGGGGGGYARTAPPAPLAGPVPPALRKPKTRWTRPNELDHPLPPGFEQDPAQPGAATPPPPSAKDIARMTADSVRRSGGSGSGD